MGSGLLIWNLSAFASNMAHGPAIDTESIMPRPAVEPEVAVGCAELPPGMSRLAFFRQLALLETRFPGDEIPNQRVVRRWRAEAGADGQLVLVAPRAICALHRSEDPAAPRAEMAARLCEAAAQAEAPAVLFPTPPEVSPSSGHRDALAEFFSEHVSAERMGTTVRVWAPDGLWRPRVAASFAASLDVVTAVDPLARDSLEEGKPEPAAGVTYARVHGLGQRTRPLSDDDLGRLAEWISPSARAFVVFATVARVADARAFKRWLARWQAAD